MLHMLERALTSRFACFLRVRGRFLVPLAVVFFAKLAGGLFLYFWLNMDSSQTFWMTVEPWSEGQNEVFGSVVDSGQRWPFLFLGWDSSWYLSILVKGYGFSSQSYAFFPGLPLFSWILNAFVQNPAVTLVVFSSFVGLLWVPVFQLVAEEYFDGSRALQLTLLYALSPYVFLFTTVAYSEGLFLLSTLGAWYFFSKRRTLFAVVLASVAAVSRPPGILILLPMLIMTIRGRNGNSETFGKWRSLFYFSVPVLSFVAWLLYCRLTIGDWFASFDRSGWNEMYSFASFVFRVLPSRGVQVLWETDVIWPFVYASWVIIALISLLVVVAVFLIRALFRFDRALALYSIVYLLGVFAFGGTASVPRFVSFIFPVWLPFALKLAGGNRSYMLTVVVCASFYLAGLFLWSIFLNGQFVA